MDHVPEIDPEKEKQDKKMCNKNIDRRIMR
jgi:hypothetical protein